MVLGQMRGKSGNCQVSEAIESLRGLEVSNETGAGCWLGLGSHL